MKELTIRTIGSDIEADTKQQVFESHLWLDSNIGDGKVDRRFKSLGFSDFIEICSIDEERKVISKGIKQIIFFKKNNR